MKNCKKCIHSRLSEDKYYFCKNEEITEVINDIIDKFDEDGASNYYENGLIAIDCQFYAPLEKLDHSEIRLNLKNTMPIQLGKHLQMKTDKTIAEIFNIIDNLYHEITLSTDSFDGPLPSTDYYKNQGWNNALDRIKKEINKKISDRRAGR